MSLHDTSEYFKLARERLVAEALASTYPNACKRCSCCKATVLLWFGRRTEKWAVTGGLSHCKYCWSVEWFDTADLAWAWFDKVQSEWEAAHPEHAPALELQSDHPF